ncbi:MAG: nucleotide exchange factor GrpE [Chlamydiota bacterium]
MSKKDAPKKEDKNKSEESEKMVEISEKELNQLKEELEDYKDKYLRVLAESENIRKRLTKEKQDHTKFIIQDVILEFLPSLDYFDKALSFSEEQSDEVKHWALGFQMILNQFKEVIANQGITIYHAENCHFDPHFHEAIETVETEEQTDNWILEEFAPGYKMGDRIIRPAHVKVAKTPAAEAEEILEINQNQEEENKQGE